MKPSQKKGRKWATGISSAFELEVFAILYSICYIKVCWIGIWGERETERAREECKNALTWQSTIKWGNVWIFITNTPLPPFLPRYPVLLGEIWEEEWGREGKECWGGLSIPLTPLLFSPGPLQEVNSGPALANSWPLLLFTSFPSSLSLMSPYNCSSSLSLLFPSSLFLSC